MSKLEQFLRHHKVLTRFKKNLKGEPAYVEGVPRNYTFKELEEFVTVAKAIRIAFSWASTPERYWFWERLDREAYSWNPLENVMEKDNV